MSRGRTRVPTKSALGQKQTSEYVRAMSALPPKADMDPHGRDVRFVPKADILRCSKERCYSITSSAIARRPDIHGVVWYPAPCCCMLDVCFAGSGSRSQHRI